MNADIRLVKLRRKAINNKNCSMDKGAFSMDYFDIINISSFHSSDSLEDIMDIGNVGSESRDDVSMQSYPLYCSGATLEKYSNDKGYGDPFLHSEEYNGMPYLSIIQVHITPEVLARVSYSSVTECIASFSEDIHLILKDYMEKSKPKMIYRVYQSLSAGDFAVVIRSALADTSFYISTLLRKRTVKIQDEDEVQLVLYKTYTVLSFYNQEVLEDDKTASKENRYVIRCCFANKYWSEKAQIDSSLNGIWNPEKIDSLKSLNGRYDFCVELTEEDFYRILPVIRFYKRFSDSDNGVTSVKADMQDKLDNQKSFDIVDYLCFLISNGYLSYVNERYLLCVQNKRATINTQSDIRIRPLKKCQQFLDKVNEEKYTQLKKRSKKLEIEILKINCFQKSMSYYFSLLQKLVHLCQTINGLSDTRIYSAMLMQQLECVLNGVEKYLETMTERKDSEILNGMEEYLRKSVCALDSYARYIRNNNLQSLQTPNYSLQSYASMEKLLIGYREFLSRLIEGYCKSNFANEIKNNTSGFLPVLIPALQDGQLSIEVMFSDVFLYNHSDNKKLMVVKCSTLQELADVPGMIAAFFHEIAHQFRYETREERNRVLVHYCTYAAFWPLVKKVSKELCREVKGLNEFREIEDILLKAVNDSFMKTWEYYLKNKEDEKYDEKPLLIFQLYLENMMNLLCNDDNQWDTWLLCKNNFLENLKVQGDSAFPLDLENETVRKAILILEDTENILNEVENLNSKYMNKVINAGCYLWKSVNHEDAPRDQVSDWDNKDSYENLMECKRMAEQNKTAYYSIKLLYLTGKRLSDDKSSNAFFYKMRGKFLEDLYNAAVKIWEKQLENPKLRGAGRYLGIDEDTEENKNEFINLILSKMQEMQDTVIHNIDYAIDVYREETSDIYMCTMLGLTPFGYLNFMAYNFPTKLGVNVYTNDVLRFLTVILSVWTTDEETESIYEHFHSIEKSIRENLEKLLDFYKADLSSGIDTDLRIVLNEIEIEYTEDDWYGDMGEGAEKVRDECRKLRSEIISQEQDFSEKKKFLKELLHYQYLCNILIELIDQYASEQLDQEGYQYVKNDLRKGAASWKKLRTEMECKPWWKYCEIVGEILNLPYLVYTDKRKEISDQMIAFLQEMYYSNKIISGQNVLYPREGEND